MRCACPNCGTVLEHPDIAVGRRLQCGKCEVKFEAKMIPEPSSPPAAAAAATPTPAPRPAQNPKPKATSSALPLFVGLALAGILLGGGFWQWNRSRPAAAPAATAATSKPTNPAKPNPAPVPAAPIFTALPAGLAPLPERKPVLDFSRFDIGKWRRDHPSDGGNGWFPGGLEVNQEDGTKRVGDDSLWWGHWIGPLGIRVRSHLSNWQGNEAFAAMVPECLRAQDGKLAMQAMEVTVVVPGSPADGRLFPGDLIFTYMEQPILDATEYRPEQKFKFKERRDIQVQAGELTDLAESQGEARMKVLRYPRERRELWNSGAFQNSEFKADVAVTPGSELRLITDDGGDGYDSDHLAWLDGVFSGTAGKRSFTDLTPIRSSSGWGSVKKGVDFADKPLPAPGYRCHAKGEIVFVVPAGMTRFSVRAKSTGKGRLAARLEAILPQDRLPVTSQTLWAGTPGNDKLPPQSFDVEIKSTGFLHLRVGLGSDGNGGDGALWGNVVFEGDYGSKKLSSLTPAAMHNGYGDWVALSPEKPQEFKGVNYTDGWRCHAVSDFSWKLPVGTKRIKGLFTALTYGQVVPEVTIEPMLEAPLGKAAAKLVDLRFALPRIGSFAKGYPMDCAKSEFLLKQTCDWLAAQQEPNGAWPCWGGYTSSTFHTAWCGLALMGSGDPKYNAAVHKAAASVIAKDDPSSWTCPRAMNLIFLSELYLRDKDAKLLRPIQNAAYQLMACVKTDLMSGHKVTGFGYGYAGQYIGTGHMQLGLALASLCPIEMDRDFLDRALAHTAEIACNGAYPYGRGWRATRDGNFNQSGGNGMHGPAALAARISGCPFSESFIDDSKKRWRASLGEGDNSHATSTLAFLWSSLAMNACDEKLFQDHMETFRYKMANDHLCDGGFVKSSFILDFQGGEGVTGLWIRSAGTALILAAPKRKLAITGNPDLIAKKLKPGVPCREYDLFVRDFYARNLSLAKLVLGPKAPASIDTVRKELLALPRDASLNRAQAKLLRQRLPTLITEVAAIPGLADETRGHAVELVSGVDFQIRVEEGKIHASACSPFQQLAWADSDDEIKGQQAPLLFSARLKIAAAGKLDKDLSFAFDGGKDFNVREGRSEQGRDFKNLGADTLPMDIDFNLGMTKISYKRTIQFKNPDAQGVTNFRRLKIRTRMAPRPIFQNQPVMLDGLAYEAMMLNEGQNFASLNGHRPAGDPIAIHDGDEVEMECVSGQAVCIEVIKMNILSRPNFIAVKNYRMVSPGGSLEGDLALLSDDASDAKIKVKTAAAQSLCTLELDLGGDTAVNGLDFHWKGWGMIYIWALVKDQWQPIAWDGYQLSGGHHPTFATITASKLRVVMNCNNFQPEIGELRPYFNSRQQQLFKPLPPSWPECLPKPE